MPAQQWKVEAIRPEIEKFLKPLLQAAHLDLGYEIESAETIDNRDLFSPDLLVKFHGRDVELLLAHRAELLLALEQLTLEVLRVPHRDRYRLVFDAEDYRLLRIEELRLSAAAAAEKVKQAGIPFRFQPMTSRERRVIHLALRDDPDVVTLSEGVAPNRHTVIYAADDERVKDHAG